ncbi:hypothetical protein [Variovorax sp. 3P27G3]|jgi:hypothetical protein|uniref:hypothetical protein n=1 Tax=Variovorax sp. 3P27G3 TaxID=2502214 RepID=UPI0010F970F2|nr:hypothetical protein [Variovorax sp. 3P27G3]
MTDSIVQTSALAGESDLFGVTEPRERSHLDAFHLTVKGVLIESAEVVTRTTADGTDVPVICMDLRPLSGAALKLHAEIPFTHPEFGRARAKAQALSKGACVVIATPLEGIYRDFLPDVRSVVLLPSH